MTLRVIAVVPSLGASSIAGEALARLRAELAPLGGAAALAWVHQGGALAPELDRAGERLVRLPHAAGFAAAVNAGAAALSPAEMVAVVNDDALLEPGWLAALLEELARRPGVAAVQGVNLELDTPERVDGCGLAWNDDWQAIQIGRGEAPPDARAEAFELFGVSATAALYRSAALAAVARPTAPLFDERLGSYYEDVELAVRLRAAGFASWCVPRARARHQGQGTTRRAPRARWRQLYRNRRWVVATLLGERYPFERARIVARDRRDLARRLATLDLAAVSGIVAGTREAEARPTALGLPEAAAAARALEAALRLRAGLPA
jgi:GT2 family glycosyltransferase